MIANRMLYPAVELAERPVEYVAWARQEVFAHAR